MPKQVIATIPDGKYCYAGTDPGVDPKPCAFCAPCAGTMICINPELEDEDGEIYEEECKEDPELLILQKTRACLDKYGE